MKSGPCIVALAIYFLSAFPAAADTTILESNAGDRISLELTVYTSDLALVKDTRRINLPAGRGELRFVDVAASLIPGSIEAVCIEQPPPLKIMEQVFSYDLISEKTLLDRYVGKTIKIIDYNRYHDRKDVIEATLLSNRNGRIYRIGNEIYIGHPGIKVLPEIPGGLTTKPTVSWLFENNSPGEHLLETSYLTKNITWKTDYVMTTGNEDSTGSLAAWISINNMSGASYRNATVFLVAGEVHRVPDGGLDRGMERVLMTKAAEGSPEIPPESLFEYYYFEIPWPVSIEQNQARQVRFLDVSGIPVEKEYRVVSGSRGFALSSASDGATTLPVEVTLIFRNTEKANLGAPLPAGLVRLYRNDEKGRRFFIGEDSMGHTPSNGEIRLKAGETFDVKAERKQLEFNRVTTRISESRWKITIRNEKKEEIHVSCMEVLHGSWEITEASHPFDVIDAFRIQFDCTVPPEDSINLVYTVRTES